MDKIEYLEALKRAMTGLAPEAQAKTLAFYEQRFVDGVAAGRSEAEIAAEQDDPRKIAMTLRANSHMAAFTEKKNPANFVRMAFAAVGLAIFNLFMVVPAMVYAAMLTVLYVCGLTFYLAGTVITASGLSGTDEIKLTGPLRHILDDGESTPTRVTINEQGINIITDRDSSKQGTSVVAGKDAKASKEDDSEADSSATTEDSPKDDSVTARDSSVEADPIDAIAERAAKRAETAVSERITIASELNDETRATQVFVGIGLVLGGILLILLSLVITRYTVIGVKRYIEMNLSLLKGH
ncbi:DUF1700 domain-containing protein [Massilia sp. CF038]|uniref:DUF1700 domain-containing protein n=1 Tax=Massilia sp. CF038 TaxID=1881045 RepID=UPI0009143898|nr:DUF1700 domain-containing protein [Massilia sp. CF038]SHG94768.1 Protein of unknown function [Massilia sp. CF038]